MAELTLEQKINRLSFYNLPNNLKDILTDITEEIIPTDEQLEDVAVIGTTTALTTVPASFASEVEVQAYLVTLRANVESRLDTIEAKVDAILNALKGE